MFREISILPESQIRITCLNSILAVPYYLSANDFGRCSKRISFLLWQVTQSLKSAFTDIDEEPYNFYVTASSLNAFQPVSESSWDFTVCVWSKGELLLTIAVHHVRHMVWNSLDLRKKVFYIWLLSRKKNILHPPPIAF